MSKPVRKQVNLNLKVATNNFIARTAKKNKITKAQVIEDAILAYKQAA